MVGVIDTGVDVRHPDLAGAVLPGVDLIGGTSSGQTDISGHGTGVAGLIAARGRGAGHGALGIAPKAKILPIRDQAISYTGSEIVAGINWSAQRGAGVICIASTGDPSPELEAAVHAALKADIVVVAGVGNRPDSTRVEWPAAYPGVIAAAGVDRKGNHADVSVTGPEVVLAAPAVDIVSTDKLGETGYRKGTGTSDATAIIAGAAALVRSKYPNLPAAEVVHRLTATAVDKGPPGRDEQYGYGVLDLRAALTADVPAMTASPSATGLAGPSPVGPVSRRSDGSDDRRWPVLVGYVLVCLVVLAAAGVAAVLVFRRRQT